MRRAWCVLLPIVLAFAACGTDPDSDASPDGDQAVQLAAPGTRLVAGLVVPPGAQLVGPVFPAVPFEGGPEQTTTHAAVLELDGNPFAAWDDLARQAHDIGVAVPGSGICWWLPTSPGVGEAPPGASVLERRPAEADALVCEAGARGPLVDGSQVMVQLRLWWWAAGAELHLEVTEGDMGEAPYSYPDADPGPAPATAVDDLPERDEPSSVDVGDPFGRENNCFEVGYRRLTLPDGARLVGGGATPGLKDFAAVLAVEDAKAVLEDLRDQLDDPDDANGHYRLTEENLADGTPVWVLAGGVDAGGGGCYMWSSPQGNAILVTTSSD